MNVELLKALHEAILRCHADPRVRVVLLTGEGRNFCAGGDIHTFESKGERAARLSARSDGVAAAGHRRADPAARSGGDRGAGFRGRRRGTGSGVRIRHRRRRTSRRSSSPGRCGSAWRPTADHR